MCSLVKCRRKTFPSERSGRQQKSEKKPEREWPTTIIQPKACGSTHGKIKWSTKEFLENMIKHEEEKIKRKKYNHCRTKIRCVHKRFVFGQLQVVEPVSLVHYWWPTGALSRGIRVECELEPYEKRQQPRSNTQKKNIKNTPRAPFTPIVPPDFFSPLCQQRFSFRRWR